LSEAPSGSDASISIVTLTSDPTNPDIPNGTGNGYVLEFRSGSGNQQVLGASVWANGFKIVGCIGEDILLPENSTVEFTGPLSMCFGATLTVPAGTILTIL
jgi:hypothetical protein